MSDTTKPRSLVRPILTTDHVRRDWSVFVNGAQVKDPESVEISAPRFGMLRYGLTPSGHDGWGFAETGGGGAVIVPFCIRDGRLLIGLIRQSRPFLGGQVVNAPRGFTDTGEGKIATARRELGEETGLGEERVFQLMGPPVNCNSAFFETPSEDLGTQFFALELSPDMLEPHGGVFHPRPEFTVSGKNSHMRALESIVNTEFVPWTDAVACRDMFTLAAVARLFAWLHDKNRLTKTL